jgi:hypothetical protein
MLKAIRIRNDGFMPLYPVPSMTTPFKWFGPLIGSGIAFNTIGLNKYIGLSNFLWGMWGDRVLSLMQRGIAAPHKRYFVGEIPHKKWGAETLQNQSNKSVPHKKCGELPTEETTVSLASRGFAAYLPNSPHFTDTCAYIFLHVSNSPAGPSNREPIAGEKARAIFEFLCLYRSRLQVSN